jgi:2-oxoglutarate dehydrogenase E1 component
MRMPVSVAAVPVAVVPVAIHGDAAFPGEGIVAETLNISNLKAYRTGGTIHIIVNNQVGFTTDPTDARSTHYSSDLAKGFEIPIFHVNADDAEACIIAMRLACAYRATFKKDVLIDLVGYRRHGHNEGDEPMYTQPTRTAAIRKHPTVPQVWASRLVSEGVMSADEAAQVEKDVSQRYADIHSRFKQSLLGSEKHAPWPVDTAAVAVEKIRPIRSEIEKLLGDRKYLTEVINKGRLAALSRSEKVRNEVYKRIGFIGQ